MRRVSRLFTVHAASFCSTTHAVHLITKPRHFHVCSYLLNKPIEPITRDKSDEDHFADMMDDRTNALLHSLGVDAKTLGDVEKSKDLNGSDKAIASVPLVAAIDVNTGPIHEKSIPHSHFFDTQDVYSELRSAGLTAGQAEVIMRTMQDLIHELVKTCKDRSVPISAAANEAYLFDAASSEVRNEISNSRQNQATTYRSGLARLQRDVEILEHEATEMTSLLKSDLDIEVHERKNATRAEESIIQLKIQDLNNKISTRLNSELKSEIENLRWQITRRSLAAIGVVVAMFIWLTQTNSRTKSAKTQERQRQSVGMSIPVPVLAPSMASTDESYEHNVNALQVEHLSNYSGQYDGDAVSSSGDCNDSTLSDNEQEIVSAHNGNDENKKSVQVNEPRIK